MGNVIVQKGWNLGRKWESSSVKLWWYVRIVFIWDDKQTDRAKKEIQPHCIISYWTKESYKGI